MGRADVSSLAALSAEARGGMEAQHVRPWVLFLRILTLTLLLLLPARADDPGWPLWNVAVPETWTADAPNPGDESLVTRIYPKDSTRPCMVVVRRYHNKEATTLEDELTQLRYGVVLKLEGKILSQQTWPVAGQPGLKVVYEGRSSKGAFKKFVRYMTVYQGDLLTVHCVASSTAPQDLLEFQAIAEGITVSVPSNQTSEPH